MLKRKKQICKNTLLTILFLEKSEFDIHIMCEIPHNFMKIIDILKSEFTSSL